MRYLRGYGFPTVRHCRSRPAEQICGRAVTVSCSSCPSDRRAPEPPCCPGSRARPEGCRAFSLKWMVSARGRIRKRLNHWPAPKKLDPIDVGRCPAVGSVMTGCSPERIAFADSVAGSDDCGNNLVGNRSSPRLRNPRRECFLRRPICQAECDGKSWMCYNQPLSFEVPIA